MTEVQFRKYNDGEVIAVFPYIVRSKNTILSYDFKDEYSLVWWDINHQTTAAKYDEYLPLLTKIKSMYVDDDIRVIEKRSHRKYLAALELAYPTFKVF